MADVVSGALSRRVSERVVAGLIGVPAAVCGPRRPGLVGMAAIAALSAMRGMWTGDEPAVAGGR
ncbi:hypothetical protein L6E12_00740 [Actinokineospora sp. PR83]|uniref:hypothetical protein n=1 Tax=Actinokineospora sp. PR83 TaxID=2884908 RepID=UPI001F232786|nr:hypothetical protein [Actinokineospora sp. PR83]MCG8914324.1 hypothetical protein [Actinokineospora sp. PR83]